MCRLSDRSISAVLDLWNAGQTKYVCDFHLLPVVNLSVLYFLSQALRSSFTAQAQRSAVELKAHREQVEREHQQRLAKMKEDRKKREQENEAKRQEQLK